MSELIITNGDSAAGLIKESGLGALVLPWRDVLHEGPIHKSASLIDSAPLRAEYLSQRFGLEYETVFNDFNERNAIIQNWCEFDEVSLWFEHDLYDQLQLLEILAFLSREKAYKRTKVTLVQSSNYLGLMSVEDIVCLETAKAGVGGDNFALTEHAWEFYCDEEPHNWASLLNEDLSLFPFLRSSVERQLEELPDVNGINRTERQILLLLIDNPMTPIELFRRSQKLEEAIFLGDWSFFGQLSDLMKGERPLVQPSEGDQQIDVFEPSWWSKGKPCHLEITNLGEQVLNEKFDFLPCRQPGWYWGKYCEAVSLLWRWDHKEKVLRHC